MLGQYNRENAVARVVAVAAVSGRAENGDAGYFNG